MAPGVIPTRYSLSFISCGIPIIVMSCAPLFVYGLIIAQRTIDRTLYMDPFFCFADKRSPDVHATCSVPPIGEN